MIGPTWAALPPELLSLWLSSGPGPGPWLAAATAWSSLSAECAGAADQLLGLLAAVQPGVWAGLSAAQYVTAHALFLNWLLDVVAKGVVAAMLYEMVATAYAIALAAMPTLAELAANRVVFAALVMTNFFGQNLAPIAVVEGEYEGMRLRAAETMATYQAVTESALAAAPADTPAPQLVAPGAEADVVVQPNQAHGTAEAEAEVHRCPHCIRRERLNKMSPFARAVSSWLMDFLELSPAPDCPVCATVDALTTVGNVVQQALPFVIMVFSALAGMTAAATAGASAAGAAGIAIPLSVALPMATAAPAGATPTSAGAGSIPAGGAPAPMATSAAASGPGATMGGGSAGGGPGVGFGGNTTNSFGTAGVADFLYAVGLSGLSSRSSVSRRASRKATDSFADDAEASAAAAASTSERARRRRGRRAIAQDRSHRYEVMDLDSDSDLGSDDAGPGVRPDEPRPALVGASHRSAGPLGFAGAATQSDFSSVGGLAALDGDEFNSGPALPMLPSSWSND